MSIMKDNNNIDLLSSKCKCGDNFFIKGLVPSESQSELLYSKNKKTMYREIIKKGAFAHALEVNIPKLLINHNHSKELKCKSLKIYESKYGLEFETVVEYNRELAENYSNIKSLSFGFSVDVDLWIEEDEVLKRNIYFFKELTEISILINNKPAYEEAKVVVIPIRKEIEKLKVG